MHYTFYHLVLQIVCPADDFTSCADKQLVLYSPPKFLQPLLEREKKLVFAGREWVVEQNWDGVGIAAVIWEAVSATTFKSTLPLSLPNSHPLFLSLPSRFLAPHSLCIYMYIGPCPLQLSREYEL